MGRLVTFILASAVVLGIGYYVVQGNVGITKGGDKSAPAQTLDRVREKAHDIEQDAQKRADDLMRRTTPER